MTARVCAVCGGDASRLHCRYEAQDGRTGRVCSKACAQVFEAGWCPDCGGSGVDRMGGGLGERCALCKGRPRAGVDVEQRSPVDG